MFFVSFIKSSDLDAMTVPATFISAISLAKLGPLKTPTLFVLLKQQLLMRQKDTKN